MVVPMFLPQLRPAKYASPNLHGGHIALIALLHEARDFLLQKPWEIRQGFIGQWAINRCKPSIKMNVIHGR